MVMADPDERGPEPAPSTGRGVPAPGRLSRHRRRWVLAALGVLAVLGSLVFGVTTARVTSSLGPHEAVYAVSTDGTVTVDVGPLGTLQIASPLPLHLGVRVTVGEIPASFTELDQASTLQALSGDAASYVQFFSAPQAAVHDVARGLVVDAATRAVGALAVLTGVWWLGRTMLGERRRAELTEAVWRERRRVALGATLTLVVVVVATSSGVRAPSAPEGEAASAVFAGTPLEGARVTGRLGGVLDTYGGYVVDAYRENQAFYARADAALATAWDAQEIGRRQSQDVATRLERLVAGPTATPAPERELLTLVVVSDLHCNVGMAPLVTTLVERTGAEVVLDAGDTTMNGTSVEQYCVTTFARAVPRGVDLVTSPGNHDSDETSRSYARAGATVLSGSVVTVRGLRVLGDHDPNQTRVGGGTSSAGVESLDVEAARLAATACDDPDGVDLLLIHNPAVGQPALDEGCVPAQVSGHLHQRYGPEVVGQGVRYVSSSTAGATLGEPTIGVLRGTAELTVLRWDPAERAFVDHQLVEVHPDGTVDLGPRTAWPPRPPVSLDPEVPGLP